ncbi:uncharacterized protein L969DRAFT_20316 [Mixia osmundae IAM 14324]|uniref:DNA replication licensing factor MCM7 n=1 Tax=Mixia osmundae (strain CBS 9802 / IAM 14324 / JCM 22182 / KY 12970) TaxID=764103 RepID=G7EB44_MIXOS|nr:uncharacterized protein L969DRAFT_20316 [Mixia osmundae IAM 14324]KEI36577.1 hypothetical protein L969DRAFT_20316 [Mixia osmundae IAM 14324]GAB00055.1 hypothetical protein E5Q_06757 [Mixia osmundae IAM 14324]
MALPVINLPLDYEAEAQTIQTFLQKCTAPTRAVLRRQGMIRVDGMDDTALEESARRENAMDADMSSEEEDELAEEDRPKKYLDMLQRVANREQEKLVIELDDVYRVEGAALVAHIMQNALRYRNLFGTVVDLLMPEATVELTGKEDVLDTIMEQRRERSRLNEEAGEEIFPMDLVRRYNLYFKPRSGSKALAVREVRGAHLGKYITVRGIVTRVSEVKPLLLVTAYTCDSCGVEIFQEVAQKTVKPLTACISQACVDDGGRGTLHMLTRACKFSPFQELKIQEMADQVPVGHIPRTMTIHLNGNMTRQVSPGDVVNIGGIFLPMRYEGFKAMRLGLQTDTYLEAHHIHQLKKQYEAMELTPKIVQQVQELKEDPRLYAKLATSIAPEIYGHEDVKKALLLLLVGGVTKNMGDGMKIRGDINICLMGDPGVAKSQLLKYITKIAPRGVYTTGRGSSGVGLTAAVMRDPVTDEMVLEGGALVLADNGIACIDEFDKMDESDRTAIHEVMEQQTISISKAGITTTLNARTSILAAANPLYGRYNPKISPVDNINLPAALLSRFDILFLILDTPTRDDDERLAQHITYVHMHSQAPELLTDIVSPTLMRHYIALARQKRPTVPPAVSEYVVGAYVQLRKQSKEDEDRNQAFTYTSARTLLGILRLSQALARLRFADEVEIPDVDEALRLSEVSKSSLYNDDADMRAAENDRTDTSKIYRIIRDMNEAASEEDDALSLREIRERVLAKGFTESSLTECLDTYEELDVWQREAQGTMLRFLQA